MSSYRDAKAETKGELAALLRVQASRYNVADFREAVFMTVREIAADMEVDTATARMVRRELRRRVREWWAFEDAAYERD